MKTRDFPGVVAEVIEPQMAAVRAAEERAAIESAQSERVQIFITGFLWICIGMLATTFGLFIPLVVLYVVASVIDVIWLQPWVVRRRFR